MVLDKLLETLVGGGIEKQDLKIGDLAPCVMV